MYIYKQYKFLVFNFAVFQNSVSKSVRSCEKKEIILLCTATLSSRELFFNYTKIKTINYLILVTKKYVKVTTTYVNL